LAIAEGLFPNLGIRCLVDSVYRLRQGEFRSFKDAQSLASRGQFEQRLIFQGEIQEDVSRADAKHNRKRKMPSATTPTARNVGIRPDSVHGRTEHAKESARPFDQKPLKRLNRVDAFSDGIQSSIRGRSFRNPSGFCKWSLTGWNGTFKAR
jgi:hypothetical protein